jgi:hypothetical protein
MAYWLQIRRLGHLEKKAPISLFRNYETLALSFPMNADTSNCNNTDELAGAMFCLSINLRTDDYSFILKI